MVTLSVKEGIATIVLDSPPLNLLSNKVKEELTTVFQNVSENKLVRVILFKTVGNHFCCGADLKEFPERIKKQKAREAWRDGHNMLETIMNVPQPTIACMRGNVLGGGAELASAFDIRIFADNSKVGYPEVSKGVFPGNGGTERLIDLIGKGSALPLLLTGEIIHSDQALQLGIASKVVPEEKVENYGHKIAHLLTTYSNVTLRTIKKAVKSYSSKEFYENGMEYFHQLHETEDVWEAIHAFLEKRPPNFQHH